jgi:hypothetical protein
MHKKRESDSPKTTTIEKEGNRNRKRKGRE